MFKLQLHNLHSTKSPELDCLPQQAPAFIRLHLDTQVEENCNIESIIDYIATSLTSETYPDVYIMRFIMWLLMKSPPPHCEIVFAFLLSLLHVYPPCTQDLRTVYKSALLIDIERLSDKSDFIGQPNKPLWLSFQNTIRCASTLSLREYEEHKNFFYLVQFYQKLFEEDFNFLKVSMEGLNLPEVASDSIVRQMVWPDTQVSCGKNCIELADLLLETLQPYTPSPRVTSGRQLQLTIISCLITLFEIVLQMCWRENIKDRSSSQGDSLVCDYKTCPEVRELLNPVVSWIEESNLNRDQIRFLLDSLQHADLRVFLGELMLKAKNWDIMDCNVAGGLNIVKTDNPVIKQDTNLGSHILSK